MHNVHVTIRVLHLYNVILMSIFISVINDTAKSNMERNRLLLYEYSHEDHKQRTNHDVFWSVKAENLEA